MNDIWNTWHDPKFDCGKYLYHYTSVEKASKILFHKNFRFSLITRTNDTTESKIKLEFDNSSAVESYREKQDKIINFMKKQNEHMQLLCFSMDKEKQVAYKGIAYTKEDERFFIDMSGRGFALPRMWSQYADNNCGVCLVIDKGKDKKHAKIAGLNKFLRIYYARVMAIYR